MTKFLSRIDLEGLEKVQDLDYIAAESYLKYELQQVITVGSQL